jgi:hypothetical protein
MGYLNEYHIRIDNDDNCLLIFLGQAIIFHNPKYSIILKQIYVKYVCLKWTVARDFLALVFSIKQSFSNMASRYSKKSSERSSVSGVNDTADKEYICIESY